MATSRKFGDSRSIPAEVPCGVPIPGNEEEVLNRAVQHAVESHGYRETAALRELLRSMLRDKSVRNIWKSGSFIQAETSN